MERIEDGGERNKWEKEMGEERARIGEGGGEDRGGEDRGEEDRGGEDSQPFFTTAQGSGEIAPLVKTLGRLPWGQEYESSPLP